MLVARYRPAGKRLAQAKAFFLRDQRLQLRRENDRERLCAAFAVKGVHSVRVAVGVGKIRLDIKDRRAVHQIGSGHAQHGSILRVQLHAGQADAGKSDGIGTERRTGRKYADARLSAELRREDGRRPALTHRPVKLPYEPDVRKALDPAQRVGIAVFRLKNDRGFQRRRKAALTRDAEFGGEVRMNVCNRFHECSLSGQPSARDGFTNSVDVLQYRYKNLETRCRHA